MSNSHLKFDVSKLMEASTGTRETYSFKTPVKLEGIKAKSDLEGRLEIMRIEKGFNARILQAKLKVEMVCVKCLKDFDLEIRLESLERQFYFHPPRKIDDPNDLFLVDVKNQKIDISEPLRQEIILHFPEVSVCYMGCKGICAHCGKDRNQEDCSCEDDEPEAHKPLSALKDLMKKHG
ncbi:DUF177 domain-containing protein [Candidatus Peregrinibacteria bacterium]|nr:DUF177 domain-containing protein [Candidatus Peregrinibacteria bacterium]